MATGQVSEVIQHLRRTVLLRAGTELTDGRLLEDYISRRDEAALAALVHRHGPMVWGVCRRVLTDYHDAEDAFQATFLVFVRKAASIASRELLANWLYGVAHQTAIKARATAAKRKGRERQVTEMPEPAVVEQVLWHGLRPLLDEELSRLPDRYRAVIVLCDLEGKTRKEVARQLGVPEGSVAGWSSRARAMLAKRLTQRGVALSGGALAMVLSQKATAGVPSSVVSSTIKASTLFAAGQAAGVISVKVAAFTEGVLRSMLLTKLKVVMLLLFAVVAIGGSSLLCWTAAAQDAQPAPQRQGATGAQNAQPAPQGGERKDDFQPKTKEEQAIQGVWTLVSGESDGKPLKVEKDNVQVVVANEFWIWKERGKDRAFTYQIDTAQSPKQIDLTAHNIKGLEGNVLRCIYEIDGDTLKVCESDDKRPTKFSTEKGSGRTLLTFKRSDTSPPQPPDEKKNQRPADKKPVAKTDMDRLQGKWKLEDAATGNRTDPHLKELKKIKSVIKGDKITIGKGDGNDSSGSVKVDSTKQPQEMDITLTAGAHPGGHQTYRCIYKLDGDKLTVWYAFLAEAGQSRATDFLTEGGTRLMVLVRSAEKPPQK